MKTYADPRRFPSVVAFDLEVWDEWFEAWLAACRAALARAEAVLAAMGV